MRLALVGVGLLLAADAAAAAPRSRQDIIEARRDAAYQARRPALPPGFDPRFAAWRQLHHFTGQGTPSVVPLSVERRVFRVRYQWHGARSPWHYLSILCKRADGTRDQPHPLALWIIHAGEGEAYGLGPVELALDVLSGSGTWSVIVEESDG